VIANAFTIMANLSRRKGSHHHLLLHPNPFLSKDLSAISHGMARNLFGLGKLLLVRSKIVRHTHLLRMERTHVVALHMVNGVVMFATRDICFRAPTQDCAIGMATGLAPLPNALQSIVESCQSHPMVLRSALEPTSKRSAFLAATRATCSRVRECDRVSGMACGQVRLQLAIPRSVGGQEHQRMGRSHAQAITSGKPVHSNVLRGMT